MPDPVDRGKPLTSHQLAEELLKFPDMKTYMSFGGHADKPWKVRFGNQHSPSNKTFLSIEGWEFGHD